MSKIKQKSRAVRQKKQTRQQKRSMLIIGLGILLLAAVLTIKGHSLQTRNEMYLAQERELEKQIAQEKKRSEEIDELEEYVQTDEYVEQVARDKLGMIYSDEIILKAE